jgi:hypothetical protein
VTDTPVVQSRQKDRGKTDRKRGVTVLYNARLEGWQHREKVCHQKKSSKIYQLFSPGVSEYPIWSIFRGILTQSIVGFSGWKTVDSRLDSWSRRDNFVSL